MKQKINEPFFSHDIAARQDIKIIKLIAKKGYEGYGLFWAIVEFLYQNELCIDEIDVLANHLHADMELVESILTEFNLFDVEDDKFYSQRIQRNIEMILASSQTGKNNVNKRWELYRQQKEELEQFASENSDFINQIVQKFSEKFKIERVISHDTNLKIAEQIRKNEKLRNIKSWELIFKEAKKGWDTREGKNVKPSLNNILKDWDAIMSGDHHLARTDKEEVRIQEEKDRAEAQEKREQEAKASKSRTQKLQEEFNAISSQQSALECFISRYPGTQVFAHIPPLFREKLIEYGVNQANFLELRAKIIKLKGWDYEI